jgi:predicted branched-subunit amino acid permease
MGRPCRGCATAAGDNAEVNVQFPNAAPMWRHPEFARGAREMVDASIGIAAWGLITGVAMGKSGVPVPLMCLMSLVVFAGSAQLAVLPLLSAGAPAWVVWATAFCVNLRFMIFSAGWRPYFIGYSLPMRLSLAHFTADLNYVIFMRRFPEPRPSPEQLPYFWGGVACNWTAWQVPSFIGMFLANAVPVHWGFGFAGTLALLGVGASLLNGRATAVAGGVAACAAVAAYALPYRLNIVVAIAAAVAMGLLIDHTRGRDAQPLDDKT